MKHHEQLPIQQNNDEQLPEIANDKQQVTDTIDGCTMDPCPMKEKNNSEQVGKCPDCGKTEKAKAAQHKE